MPVYVVGLQRSGTNMLLRGLDVAPECEVRGENDREVFRRFQIRSDDVLVSVLNRSRAAFVLVKPLCESHRVTELLDLPGVRPARAVWTYRRADDRARSEVAKFGDANLRALRRIVRGEAEGDWQSGGLGPEAIELIRSFRPESMSAPEGAALFWYVRNRLYFDLELQRRGDVLLSSYDALVRDPEVCMRQLCSFLGFVPRPELWAHIESRRFHDGRPLDLPPGLRRLCRELEERLDATRVEQAHPDPRPDQEAGEPW